MQALPFHPAVVRWFESTLGEPTPAQTEGWDAIRQGHHTLIAAPTGSGKTLAAFLYAIDSLFQEGLDSHTRETGCRILKRSYTIVFEGTGRKPSARP